MTWPKTLRRFVQLATGVHRIHHMRFSYGYKLPFVGWAYFPPFTARDYHADLINPPEIRVSHGWQRVKPADFHDCTRTGRY